MRIKRTAMAMAVAFMVLCGSVVPATAATPGMTYTPVSGSSNIIEKYLVMDKKANVPNVTFSFSIKAGSAQAASDGNLEVFAGDDKDKVAGTPTIGTAAFSQGDTTYDSVQTLPSSVTVQKQDDGATDNKDNVELTDDEKYARKDVTVDFSSVTYNEPGVYRYIITEDSGTNGVKGITNDPDDTRIMDVYVVETSDGTLKVEGYVLHNNDDSSAVPENADGSYNSVNSTKSDGFVNDYATYDLTIEKEVKGNQGSRDEYFEFTLKITDAVPGTVYDVDLSRADSTTKTNGINTTSYTNPAKLTVGDDGTVTQTYWLQNGQSIIVQGIAQDTAYSVNENLSTMKTEGYKVSAVVTGDTATGDSVTDGTRAEGSAISMDESALSITDSNLVADTTVKYTNQKNGIIPTGISVAVLPGAAMFVAGACGFAVLKRRKKNEE